MEELEIPKFGREEITDLGFKVVTMESKESEIIKIAEKVNEIVQWINSKKDQLL